MSTSQNGWAVDKSGGLQDRGLYGGVTLPNGVRRGDVAIIARYVCDQFDRHVEPLVQGHCWGWYVKGIEGSTAISNHASGTAWDLNAPRHPLGARGTFSAKQRTAIRRILDFCEGVVRWGGDYTGRADEMHFEIIGGATAVARIARKIEWSVMNPAQEAKLDRVLTALDALPDETRAAVWNHREANPRPGGRIPEDHVRMAGVVRTVDVRAEDDRDAVLAEIEALRTAHVALDAKLDQVLARLNANG